MERIEAVDHIPHQASHFIFADIRDPGSRDTGAVGVDGLEMRVAYAEHRHCLGEFGHNAPYFLPVYNRNALPFAKSGQCRC